MSAQRPQSNIYTLPDGPLPPTCERVSSLPAGADPYAGLNFQTAGLTHFNPGWDDGLHFDPSKALVVCQEGFTLTQTGANSPNIRVTEATELVILTGDLVYQSNRQINWGGTFDLTIRVLRGNVVAATPGQGNPGANLESRASWVVSGSMTLGVNAVSVGEIYATNVTLDARGNASLGHTGNIHATGAVFNGATVTGNIDAQGSVNNSGTVNGNINSRGSVMNTGTVSGYINAPTIANFGTSLETCALPQSDPNFAPGFGPCHPIGPDPIHHYRITYAPQALTCEPHSFEVRACANASCSDLVTLDASFTLAAGPFSVAGNFVNSGVTTVSQLLSTAGTFTVSLSDTSVAAGNPTQCSPAGCQVTAVDAGLLWNTFGPQQAGVPFAASIRSVRTDTETGACIADMQGTRDVFIGLQCLDPATCFDASLARAGNTVLSTTPTAVPLTFDANGTAPVPIGMRYDDVGRIAFSASATASSGATLAGSSNSFVVSPYDIGFQVQGPSGYGSGILGRAGDELEVTLTALNALGQPTPSFGRESLPASLALNSLAQVISPVGGVSGQVQGANSFVPQEDSGVIRFFNNSVSYTETGIISLLGQVNGGSYLGVPFPARPSDPLGRILPWAFRVDSASVAPFCTNGSPGFTYMAQPFGLDLLQISAVNSDGAVTQNYPDAAAASLQLFAAGDDPAGVLTDLSGRLDPVAAPLNWVDGVASLPTAPLSLVLERLGVEQPDGPYTDFQLALHLDDQEVGGPYTPMWNPDYHVSDADCSTNGSCNLVRLGLTQTMVFGRLIMPDVFGPEAENLEVSLRSYYWNGSDFQPWTRDSCTVFDSSNLQLLDNPSNLSTTAGGGSNTLQGGRSPDGSIYWSASGEAGSIEFSYEVPDWLKYGSDHGGNPTASGEFGRFPGHDSIIDWRRISP